MGRRKRGDAEPVADVDRMPILPPAEGAAAAAAGDDDALSSKADAEIDDVLEEVGSGAQVKIQRVNPDTGVPSHCGTMLAGSFSMEALADTYGGGSYLLRIFVDKRQRGPVFPVEVDPTIPPRNPRAPRGAAAQGSNMSQDLMLTMISQNMESSRRQGEVMTTMMAGFANAMTGLMQASRQQDRDPVETFTRMAEVLRPRETPGVSQLKELIELAELVGTRGGGGGDDGTLALVGKGIDAVREIVAKAPAQPPKSGAVALPAKTGGETPVVDLRLWVRALRPMLPKLLPFIGTLAPDTVADIVEQKLAPEAFSDLVQDISADMAVGAPITKEAVAPFADRAIATLGLPADKREWLTELAYEILLAANESVEEETPPAVE